MKKVMAMLGIGLMIFAAACGPKNPSTEFDQSIIEKDITNEFFWNEALNGSPVSFQVSIDTAVFLPPNAQTIRVRPHRFSEDEAEKIAHILLGNGDFWEFEPYPIETKNEIEHRLQLWESFLNDNYLKSHFETEEMADDAKNVLLEYISKYKELYETAPSTMQRTSCMWKYRPWTEYMVLSDGYAPSKSDEGFSIEAEINVGDIPYHFTALTRDTEYLRVNSIAAYISDPFSSPLNMEWNYYLEKLTTTDYPNNNSISAVKQKAMDILSQINAGEWEIDECFVSTRGLDSQKPQYIINLNAVPVISGVGAIRQEQIPALRSENNHAGDIYYSDVHMEWSSNGDLLLFQMLTPIEIISEETIDISLSTEEIKEIVKENIFANSGTINKTIHLTHMEYGLCRTVLNDTDFLYVPAVSFSGTISYPFFGNTTENNIQIVINLKDGSIIPSWDSY